MNSPVPGVCKNLRTLQKQSFLTIESTELISLARQTEMGCVMAVAIPPISRLSLQVGFSVCASASHCSSDLTFRSFA